jgi:hypothetical protein
MSPAFAGIAKEHETPGKTVPDTIELPMDQADPPPHHRSADDCCRVIG